MDVIALVSAHLCNKGPSLLRGKISRGMLQNASCPGLAAMSHLKISLSRDSSFNKLGRVVGLSSSSLYVWVVSEKLPVCHSSCHTLSFDLLSILLQYSGFAFD